MKKIFLLLIFITSFSSSMPLDSNIFKYFPLNVGNKWTYYIYQNYSPGPGYETAIIEGTLIFKDHLYYKFKQDTYIFYGNQHYTGFGYRRIDSLAGNLFSLYINANDTIDCLVDSLNSSLNDSTRLGCNQPGNWYRYGEGTYNIFGQTYPIKKFSYSTYFEGGDYHQYAKGIGYVYEFGQYLMSNASKTLRGCIINGVIHGDTAIYLGINQMSSEIPKYFSLSQNYPNPFNPSTNINFQIPKSGFVEITVFDILGKEARTLVSQELSPGTYSADFDGANMPSGVYYYRLQSGEFTQTKKMVLIK